jgi:uncharacterized protein YdeI (YjbR/CyaY-like superfamily)
MPPRGDTGDTGDADGTLFFSSAEEFGAWLEDHASSDDVLWVGFHRKDTGVPSMTWEQSVDEALCHGWIDGLRQKVDDDRFRIRFTRRRDGSRWSQRNIDRVAALSSEGRMTPRGLAAYEARSDERSGASTSAMTAAPPELPPEYEARLRENADAWSFLEDQPPGYRNLALHWVMDAKREQTRDRRLQRLIDDAANGLRIKELRR